MRYKFTKLTLADRMEEHMGARPVTMVESAVEALVDVGPGELTSAEEKKLIEFLESLGMKYEGKGEDIFLE